MKLSSFKTTTIRFSASLHILAKLLRIFIDYDLVELLVWRRRWAEALKFLCVQ